MSLTIIKFIGDELISDKRGTGVGCFSFFFWLRVLDKAEYSAFQSMLNSPIVSYRMSSVCLSICLSVTLVNCDHISWNSSKIISRSVNLGCSLFATQTSRIYSKGNTPKFGPKVTPPCWFERRRHSIANCGRMVTDSATVTMESL